MYFSARLTTNSNLAATVAGVLASTKPNTLRNKSADKCALPVRLYVLARRRTEERRLDTKGAALNSAEYRLNTTLETFSPFHQAM